MDGKILAWTPQLQGPNDFVEGEEDVGEDEEARKRKRKAVDNAYRSLMGKQVKFT
jgi:DNA excision repair protein ERCC-8